MFRESGRDILRVRTLFILPFDSFFIINILFWSLFYPKSAVCILPSVYILPPVCSLRFTLTGESSTWRVASGNKFSGVLMRSLSDTAEALLFIDENHGSTVLKGHFAKSCLSILQ